MYFSSPPLGTVSQLNLGLSNSLKLSVNSLNSLKTFSTIPATVFLDVLLNERAKKNTRRVTSMQLPLTIFMKTYAERSAPDGGVLVRSPQAIIPSATTASDAQY